MEQRLHILVMILGLGWATTGTAQTSFGGSPMGLRASAGDGTIPEVTLPAVDLNALAIEDAHQAALGIKGPYRYGWQHQTNISLQHDGLWRTSPHVGRVWQVRLHCPDALGMAVVFSEFVIPDGGRVFIYNDQGEVLGGFTAASHPGHTVLGVAPIPGDRITIEYQEPVAATGQGRLTIGQVTHVYRAPWRGFARALGDSGPCNINTICPEGDDWRPQIRSVALVLEGGGSCSGQLLNDCNNDSIPYFLMANHCLAGGDPATWVFRFNWESPVCDPTEDGPTDHTVSGSTQLVNNPGSDMLFLQLDEQPPAEFDAFYSGWDKSGAVPQQTTCIHHPSGDIKKITHDLDPSAAADQIDVGNGPADCWHVFNYESGTTEPGSSGSGLWNEHHQIVGQLYGGTASCSNNIDDYYGRFDVSYPLLEQWLGSCGDTLSGLDPGYTEPTIPNDAAITSISNVPPNVCNDTLIEPLITLKNNGTAYLTEVTIAFGIIGGSSSSIDWTGNLAPQQTANVQLPALGILNGPQTLEVQTSSPNGAPDGNTADDSFSLDFVASSPGELVTLALVPDDYGEDITWTLENAFGTVLYAGGPYANFNTDTIVREFCLGDGCYTFTINDEFGDDICCAQGNGSYTISSAFGMHAESNGQYGEGEVREFCLDGVGIATVDHEAGLSVWPNPTTGDIHLERPTGESGPLLYTLFDMTGREMAVGTMEPGVRRIRIALPELAAGSYLLLVQGTGDPSVHQVIVHR